MPVKTIVGEITEWSSGRELILPISECCLRISENTKRNSVSFSISTYRHSVNCDGLRDIIFMIQQLDEFIEQNKELKNKARKALITIKNEMKFICLIYQNEYLLVAGKLFDIFTIEEDNTVSRYFTSNLPIFEKKDIVLDEILNCSLKEAYEKNSSIYFSGYSLLESI